MTDGPDRACRYLDAIRHRPLDRPPVWLMRQAGRYLPEYRKVRAQVDFQDAIADPAVATELTLQPMRRFALDAAIVFADIMTPLESMGVAMTFDPGPTLETPVRSARELGTFDTAGVAPTLEALTMLRAELATERALIGFCGAPFTLAAYLVQGGGGGDFLVARSMAADPESGFAELLGVLADAMARYLAAQRDAGADAVQIFDSWAGVLPRDLYDRIVLPSVRRLLEGLRAQSDVPVTYFAPNAAHLLELIASLDVEVAGVDWRLPFDTAAARLRDGGRRLAVQGNIDPAVLLAGPDVTERATLDLLDTAADLDGVIVNVGHGLTPGTPVEAVAALVETVTGWKRS